MARHRDEAELRRLQRIKRHVPQPMAALGPEMIGFFKQSVQKRQSKLAKIAECWGRVVPAMLLEHCSLEGLHAGTLTVFVDSSSHLYDLKHLLLAGLQQQLLLECKSTGVRKITLKPGRWYDGDSPLERKPRF